MIKVIVGLGNPGRQYEKTRHNAGFAFLDSLVAERGAKWSSSSQFQGDVANLDCGGSRLVLLKPMTFMNRSGLSVGSLLRFYRLRSDEMLVVHDELDLPEGSVRMKRDGGHAGHNGLRDIIDHVGSRDFYRLRIGIGRPDAGRSVADYVLSKPGQQGAIALEQTIEILIAKLDSLVAGEMLAINSAV